MPGAAGAFTRHRRQHERYDRFGIRAGLLPKERTALRFRLKVLQNGTERVGGPIGDVRRRPPLVFGHDGCTPLTCAARRVYSRKDHLTW